MRKEERWRVAASRIKDGRGGRSGKDLEGVF